MNLKLKFWLLLLFIWLGLLNSSSVASTSTAPKVLHFINRLSFEPRLRDVERVESMGVERYIQERSYQGRDLAVSTDFRDVIVTLLERHLRLDDAKIHQVFLGYASNQRLEVI